MIQNRKKFLCLALPIALFINFAIVVQFLKYKIDEMFNGEPLPGLTDLIFSMPFVIWVLIGIAFSFLKTKIDSKENFSRLKIGWWTALALTPIIMLFSLALPFSHELSHYFTGTCNWGR